MAGQQVSGDPTGSAFPANAFGMGMSDGTNLIPVKSVNGIGDGSIAQLGVGIGIYNGTNYDRTRSATAASNTTGTGLLGVGNLGYDGTNWQSIGAVAGDAGFNGLAVASATKTITFTTSASGAQTILADTKVEGYSWIDIVYTSVGSGLALTGQFSTASGGTYVNGNVFSTGTANSLGALGVTTGTIYSSPIRGNFFQIAVSALTSGTFTGTITLRAVSPQLPITNATQGGTWNVGTASAVVNVGQQTSNTSAVQLSASSTVPTNGLIIQALSTNTASVFIGGSGVTTATGFELTSGSSLTITSNLNTIYVIGSNATDKV